MDKDVPDSGSKHPSASRDMDRNPSPPSSDDEEGTTEDSIGDTMYNKHWFFTTLTRLIELVTQKDGAQDDEEMELEEDMENDICKVWDTSMNEEVALFLKEFNAPEIFLGVIAKSKCNRLTEICVGILGNMACFPETCMDISNNEDLGEVLLLLMCDTDPPTLLETTRLLLTCISQVDAMNTWLERIRKQPTIRDNLCFIMNSSTNVDLLVKVGELMDKMFDVDEGLLTDWIKAGCQQPETPATDSEEKNPGVPGLVPSLLEAANQLRYDSAEGLDVYMHILQLVTTVDEGVQSIVLHPENAKRTWEFLCDLMCQDLCQAGDPPLIVQEQKTILSSVLAVMSLMFASQSVQQYTQIGKNLHLIGSLTRILENLEICQKKTDEPLFFENPLQVRVSVVDLSLGVLKDVCCEFLSNMLSKLSKDDILEALRDGHLTEEKCLCALHSLLPLYAASVNGFMVVLGEAEPTLCETLKEEISTLRKDS